MFISWWVVITITRCVCVVFRVTRFVDFILFSCLCNSSTCCWTLPTWVSKHRLVNYLAWRGRALDNASHLCCVDPVDLIVSALVEYAETNSLLFALSLLIFAIRWWSLEAEVLRLLATDGDILQVVVHYCSICTLSKLPAFLDPTLLE